MAGVVERRFNASQADLAGTVQPCACGQSARFKGRFPKTFRTALGPITLQRAYYHCKACEAGFYPRDRALQLEGSSLSPGLTRLIGTTAAQVSFAASSGLLDEVAGLQVPPKQVERSAKALGAAIAAEERDVIEPEPVRAPTIYLGMDGSGVPMRAAETAGRPGKQADGSAKSREGKVVTGWTAETRTPEGRPQRDAGSVRYSAAIESAATRDTDPEVAPFYLRVRRMAARCGFAEAERRVVLGDGAPWIWKLASSECPGAIQIVDLWHAKEKLWEVSHALYGAGECAKRWAHARCDDLEQGRFDDLLEVLQTHEATCETARLCVGYLETNRARMRYAEFRQQGLCVGSGVVEAGCKTVIGERCKRSGMRWTVDGANAILALRSCILSGGFEDYWARRAEAA